MPDKLRNAVVWVTLAQVVLVGALGMGLHGLLGCEHGLGGCGEACECGSACRSASECEEAGGRACVFCQRRGELRDRAARGGDDAAVVASEQPGGCDGCAVCDLLAQYHSAAPPTIDSLAVEQLPGEAALQLRNAVVSAATRISLSRGPPAARTTVG